MKSVYKQIGKMLYPWILIKHAIKTQINSCLEFIKINPKIRIQLSIIQLSLR